ncbi:MAG: hypothetical protein GF355_13150, partial [Candidatus Eisenbacteria bacterium]|nr:hypothetical protein [Candidatus Eisenbacteria bacterium]
ERPAVFLVPEQFTFTADRLLLSNRLAGCRHVRVLSFQRLGYFLEPEHGPAPPALDAGGREMLLRLAMERLSDADLGPLAPQRGREGFIATLAETVRDLHMHAARPDAPLGPRLTAAGAAWAEPAEAGKLRALGRILEAYESLLSEHDLRDAEDRLDWVAGVIDETGAFARGRSVFVDGFMSFTAPEIRILAAMARHARDFRITLCCDPQDLEVYRTAADAARASGVPCPEIGFPNTVYGDLRRPAFSPTARTLLLLEETFRRSGSDVRLRALNATPRFARAPEMAAVERNSVCFDEGGAGRQPHPDGAVTLQAAVHPAQEVILWARQIDRWVRLGELQGKNPPRYRDAAVLLRDPGSYAGLIEDVFPRYGIPYFLDVPQDLTAHPVAAVLLAVLRILERRWSRDSVMTLLRSPLLDITTFEADLVDNVSLEYGIEFSRWHAAPWKAYIQPPRRAAPQAQGEAGEEDTGGAEDEPEDEDEPSRSHRRWEIQQAQVELGNRVRRRILERIAVYESTWREQRLPFAEASRGLLQLAGDLGFLHRARALARDPAELQRTHQVIECISSLLEDGIRLMGDVPVSPALFAELLRDGLRALRLGRTPQSLDAVLIGDFQRSRINEARAVIVGGLTSEAVPRVVLDHPFFSAEEAGHLARAGLQLGPSPQARQDEEAYLAYIALTRARERMLLTYPAGTTTGESLHVSPYLSLLARRLGWRLPQSTTEEREGGIQTEDELIAAMGESLAETIRREETGESRPVPAPAGELPLKELWRSVSDDPLARAPVILRKSYSHERPWRLEEATLPLLHPDGRLVTSSSGLENFAGCPYRRFAQKVLRLEPRPEAVPQPRDTGSALHQALEILFGRYDRLPPPEEVRERLREIFTELHQDPAYLAFTIDPPSRYEWERGRRGLTHFAEAEARRLQASRFLPARAEAAFGFAEKGSVPPLIIPAGTSGNVVLRGRIDRVDVLATPEELARGLPPHAPSVVLDYKSRNLRETVRTALEKGERLQTGIYMLALQDLFGLDPAGGFYVGVLPRPVAVDEAGDEINPLKVELRGVILGSRTESYDATGAFIGGLGRSGKTGLDAGELDDLLGIARAYVAAYGARILRGEIRAVPLQSTGGQIPQPCRHCDYRSLCRFDLLRDPVLKGQPDPQASLEEEAGGEPGRAEGKSS